MNPNKCDITVVLDRSGSMVDIAVDMIGGFNQFIREQRDLPGEAFLTLVQFDTRYEFVYRGIPLKEVHGLALEPRGGTALLDAVGRAIAETGERLRKIKTEDRPGKVVFMVITDGQENSSLEFNKSQVQEKIKHQQDVYNWQFVFLGANQDAFAEAGGIGINARNVSNYKNTPGSVQAMMEATSANLKSFRASASVDMAYSAAQKQVIENS